MRGPDPLAALRSWFTIDEAAVRLSELLETRDQLTGAHVLMLGLEQHLKLSVKIPELDAMAFKDQLADTPSVPTRISGVWDLPMSGAAKREVESEYNRRRDLPYISMEGTPGAIVERYPERCQLFPDRGAKGMWPRSPSALPKEAVIGVDASALQDFVNRIKVSAWQEAFRPPKSISEPDSERPIGTKERTTYLTIIAALAHAAEMDISKPTKASEAIEALTIEIGSRVAARTIENYLKAIPDALERRGKLK